jgi:nucleoside-diphosphate-sugar epimerase
MTRPTDKPAARILITGATGAIGPRVVHALHEAGFKVRAFAVDAPAQGIFPPPVEVIIGDVTNKADVDSAMQGVEAVVHLAALLHIVNPPPGMRAKYERINVGGTAAVVAAAISAGVKRIVLFSTIAVYGQAYGQVLNEQSPTHPDTFYGQTKLAAEKIVLNARGADGHPLGTVLRLGAVYGSRIKGNYKRLTHALARHRFIPIGNGLNRRTLVYDQDVAAAAVLAVGHAQAAGRIYNVSDGHYHSMNDIINAICNALDRDPPVFKLPLRPAYIAAAIAEDLMKMLGKASPMGRKTIEKFTEDIAVDSSRIRNELGFVSQYDLVSGWLETVEEMREREEI